MNISELAGPIGRRLLGGQISGFFGGHPRQGELGEVLDGGQAVPVFEAGNELMVRHVGAGVQPVLTTAPRNGGNLGAIHHDLIVALAALDFDLVHFVLRGCCITLIVTFTINFSPK